MVKSLPQTQPNGNDLQLNGFFFKPKKSGINWRLLSAVNVDEILRSNNANELVPLIEIITNGNIMAGTMKC